MSAEAERCLADKGEPLSHKHALEIVATLAYLREQSATARADNDSLRARLAATENEREDRQRTVEITTEERKSALSERNQAREAEEAALAQVASLTAERDEVNATLRDELAQVVALKFRAEAAETLAADRAREVERLVGLVSGMEDLAKAQHERSLAALAQVASLREFPQLPRAEAGRYASVDDENLALRRELHSERRLRSEAREQLATAERRHVETLVAESAARDVLRGQLQAVTVNAEGLNLGEMTTSRNQYREEAEGFRRQVAMLREALSLRCKRSDVVPNSACPCCQPRFRALAASESDWLAGLKERAVKAGVDAAGAVLSINTEECVRNIDALEVKAIAAGVK